MESGSKLGHYEILRRIETQPTADRVLQDNDSSYKRPRWVEFRDELPETGSGNIQRSALRS